MNPFSLLSIGAAGLSLLLSIFLLYFGISNQGQQSKMQDQQQELVNKQQDFAKLQQQAQGLQQRIQAGQSVGEVGRRVLEDLGGLVIQKKNERIKSLLAKHAIQVNEPKATPKAAPAATPAP